MKKDKLVPKIKACPLVPEECAYLVSNSSPLFNCNKCLQALTCEYFKPNKLVPESKPIKIQCCPKHSVKGMMFGISDAEGAKLCKECMAQEPKIAVPSKFYLEEPPQFSAEHDEWFLHYRIDQIIDCLTKIVDRL